MSSNLIHIASTTRLLDGNEAGEPADKKQLDGEGEGRGKEGMMEKWGKEEGRNRKEGKEGEDNTGRERERRKGR